MKKVLLTTSIIALFTSVSAQTKLDAVVRPRMEYRDGFSSPSVEDGIGATFVQQRTRISLTTKVKGVELKIVPQDIRVWGQVASLNANDGLNSLHEGWMKFNLDSLGKWTAKIGRQELVYDDARILGNVDWAQQGRSHDAGLVSYNNGKYKLDAVVAYNQNGAGIAGNTYTLAGQTKGLQLLHLSTKIKNVKSSFLIMNNLFQDNDLTANIYALQTVGMFHKYAPKDGKFVADLAFYGQFGKVASGNETSAFLASGNVLYKSKKTKFALGAEYISGTDMDATDDVNRSFNPIFGTNHKFNGLMDYYFVGNHGGNVGLLDLSVKVIHPFSKKFKAVAMFHQFNSAANVTNGIGVGEEADNDLGQEIDFVFKYNLNDNVKVSAGYSQYFSTTSLSFVKGLNNTSALNHWGWIMVSGSISKVFSDN